MDGLLRGYVVGNRFRRVYCLEECFTDCCILMKFTHHVVFDVIIGLRGFIGSLRVYWFLLMREGNWFHLL